MFQLTPKNLSFALSLHFSVSMKIHLSSKKTLFSFLHQNRSPSIKVIAKLILDQYMFSIFSSYFAEHSFILFFSHSEFMHVIIHIFVHWILFSHSVLYKIALIYFCWHVVVHFMRGFSHIILTRNFVNTNRSFFVWTYLQYQIPDLGLSIDNLKKST